MLLATLPEIFGNKIEQHMAVKSKGAFVAGSTNPNGNRYLLIGEEFRDCSVPENFFKFRLAVNSSGEKG